MCCRYSKNTNRTVCSTTRRPAPITVGLATKRGTPGTRVGRRCLGKNAGLEFKAFRPRSEVPRDFYAEVPIEIEFTGGFHEIAEFFDRVAKLPRIVNVSELEMTIGGEDSQSTQLKVKGKATTFRFVEEAPEDAKPAGAAAGRARARGGAA